MSDEVRIGVLFFVLIAFSVLIAPKGWLYRVTKGIFDKKFKR